jgi:hypothetical protein
VGEKQILPLERNTSTSDCHSEERSDEESVLAVKEKPIPPNSYPVKKSSTPQGLLQNSYSNLGLKPLPP